MVLAVAPDFTMRHFAALVGYEDAVGSSIHFYSAVPDGAYTDGSYMRPDNKSDDVMFELIEEILK